MIEDLRRSPLVRAIVHYKDVCRLGEVTPSVWVLARPEAYDAAGVTCPELREAFRGVALRGHDSDTKVFGRRKGLAASVEILDKTLEKKARKAPHAGLLRDLGTIMAPGFGDAKTADRDDRGKAIDALNEFKGRNTVPRSTGSPYLINTGRLVEFDADPDAIMVYVYADAHVSAQVYLDTAELVRAVDAGARRHVYRLDDRGGGQVERRIDIEHYPNRPDEQVRVYCAERRDDGKWAPLHSTASHWYGPGIMLVEDEWSKLVRYARLQDAYGKACRASRNANGEMT